MVRTVIHNGEPYFVAADVAVLLGYCNPQEAIRTHCKGVSETRTPTAGGMQTANIIPERDVYRLIMRSHLASAEEFEDHVVSAVLPAPARTALTWWARSIGRVGAVFSCI